MFDLLASGLSLNLRNDSAFMYAEGRRSFVFAHLHSCFAASSNSSVTWADYFGRRTRRTTSGLPRQSTLLLRGHRVPCFTPETAKRGNDTQKNS